MLTVVTFKWGTKYRAEHVNRLRLALRQHYPRPHRFVCVTDDAAGVEGETMALWRDHGTLVNPTGPERPSCFRRLKLFAPEARALFGGRIVNIDLDCVILGDLTAILERGEDCIFWRDPAFRPGGPVSPYNGSLFMLTAGARPQVWESFRGEASVEAIRLAGIRGSDQAWFALALGGDEATWNDADGILWSVRLGERRPPAGARIVFFSGYDKRRMRRLPWVQESWRALDAAAAAERRASLATRFRSAEGD